MGRHGVVPVAHADSVPVIHGGVHQGVAHEGGGNVPHRNVGALSHLVVAVGAQGGHRGEGRHHAAGVVHGVAQFHGRPVGVAGQVAQSTQGSEHGRVSGVARLGAGLPVGRQGHHDDVGLDLAELRVAQAEAVHHAGPEVLQHHVGDAHQVVGQFQGPRLLEVEGDGALAGVDLLKGRRGFAVHGVRPPRDVQSRGRLDLDHIGAQRGQDHAGKGTRGVHGKIGDANAGERSGCVGHGHRLSATRPPSRSGISPGTPAAARAGDRGWFGPPR